MHGAGDYATGDQVKREPICWDDTRIGPYRSRGNCAPSLLFDVTAGGSGFYSARCTASPGMWQDTKTGFSSVADAKAHCDDWLRRHLENPE
jgi:hypothetical protein